MIPIKIIDKHNKICKKLFSTIISNKFTDNHFGAGHGIDLTTSEKTENHVFKNVYTFRSGKQVSKYLTSEGLLYNSGSLIAFNKPSGLPIKAHSKPNNKIVNQTLNSSSSASYQGNIIELLPRIAIDLKVEGAKLNVIKAPERYTSGVTLISGDENISQKLSKNFRKAKIFKEPYETYLAIAHGIPNIIKANREVGITLEQSKFSNIKMPKIVNINESSKNALKYGDTKCVLVDHEVISKNENLNVSLVKISCTNKKWHFLRVYLASLLSPILGDNIHGSRVHFDHHHAKEINSMSHLASLPQKLPRDILENLSLKSESIIPLHLHLSTLILPTYKTSDINLTINAPLPEFFKWACNRLKLEIPKQYLL